MCLHSLPFRIGYSGPAEVDQAFPVILNEDSNVLQSAFRGRKLVGKTHNVPNRLNGT